jgi:hypothetical protein
MHQNAINFCVDVFQIEAESPSFKFPCFQIAPGYELMACSNFSFKKTKFITWFFHFSLKLLCLGTQFFSLFLQNIQIFMTINIWGTNRIVILVWQCPYFNLLILFFISVFSQYLLDTLFCFTNIHYILKINGLILHRKI